MFKLPKTLWADKESNDFVESFIIIIFTLGLVGISYLSVFGLAHLIGAFYDELQFLTSNSEQGLKRWVLAVFIGATCIGLGKLLFMLRQYRRDVYGFLELGSAFSFAVEVCGRETGKFSVITLLAVLLGAVYVSVRGWDNIDQYKSKSN